MKLQRMAAGVIASAGWLWAAPTYAQLGAGATPAEGGAAPAEERATVWDRLDAAGPVVFLGHVDGRSIVVIWDQASSAFGVWVGGLPVHGLVTTAAGEGDLAFEGVGVVGRVRDVEGRLVLDLDAEGGGPIRSELRAGGGTTVCACGGSLGEVTRSCVARDCDDAQDCRKKGPATTGYCSWRRSAGGAVVMSE